MMKTFLLLIFSGFIILSACHKHPDYSSLKSENIKLHLQLDSLQMEMDSLKVELETAHKLAMKQRAIAESTAVIARMQADSARAEKAKAEFYKREMRKKK